MLSEKSFLFTQQSILFPNDYVTYDRDVVWFLYPKKERKKYMEAKDVVTIVVAVAMAAVIGFLMIKMMQNFMAADGIFKGFIEDIFTAIYEKALGMM